MSDRSNLAVRSAVVATAIVALAVLEEGVSTIAAEPSAPPILGRWNVVVQGTDVSYPSWFEVRKSGRQTLVGAYVGRFGSARPVAKVEWNDGRMRFAVPPQWEERDGEVVFEGRLEGDIIRGETTDDDGTKLTWEAKRAAPLLKPEPAAWGAPIELFNGRDLSGWKQQAPGTDAFWSVKEGVLVNEKVGDNLVTEEKFGDFKLHVEFRYPKGSNSGIYLRGRYEVQIIDGSGPDPDFHDIGAVYGFIAPNENAAKGPDEWQTYEITLVGRRVTILLNGQRIVDRQVIPGTTGGALDADEAAPGPILLQGDHGPVDFRKVTLTPAKG